MSSSWGCRFNHSTRRDVCHVNWRSGKGVGDGYLEIRTSKAVPAGSQLCISYGDRSSEDFLETYGFVLPR